MVSSTEGPIESKNTEEYDLIVVHALVRDQKLHFSGTRTSAHLLKMDFTDQDLLLALLSLTPAYFHKSHKYEGIQSWHDVYLLPCYRGSNGNVFDLYIKFRIPKSGALVLVCSFHPEGWE